MADRRRLHISPSEVRETYQRPGPQFYMYIVHRFGIERCDSPSYQKIDVTIWMCPNSECGDKAMCLIVHLV